MASIVNRTRSDGTDTYRIAYRQGGKLCWTPTIPTAEGAAEMLDLVKRLGPDAALAILRQRTGRDETSAPLLRDALEHHLKGVAAVRSRGTAPEYRRVAHRTWLPRLGDVPVDALTREAVVEWVAWQREQTSARGRPYAPKTIANAHGLLSGVLKDAVEAGWARSNVAAGVPLPSDMQASEMEVLDAEEWARFITAMDEHYRPLTWFLLAVGCRIGEATALQVRDLDPVRSTIRIRRAWKRAERGVYLGSPKSKRSVRTVLLPRDLTATLVDLTAGREADALIFTTRTGRKIDPEHYRSRQWARAIRAAEITKHITPHGLRHTSASWQLAEGVSPIVVQHRLGHESLATTSKVYAHLLTDAQVAAVQVMQRAAPAQIEA